MTEQKNSLGVRLMHWGVAISVLLNAFLLETGSWTHRYFGYLAVALVVTRLVLSQKIHFEHYNAKARYVYWSIWACIGILGVSGYMMEMDSFFGNQTLENVHSFASNAILFFVALHLIGIFTDAWLHKRKTWMVMITGKRE